MNGIDAKEMLIREFDSLQRIKHASDMQKEIAHQERLLKVRLQALGISTEEIEMQD